MGKFGYSESSNIVGGETVGETFDSSDTTLTVSDEDALSAGQTLLIESEQLYISKSVAEDLTVVRGVNGTTAVSHASGTAISVVEYPNPIREAVLLEAGLLLETRGYRRQLGNF